MNHAPTFKLLSDLARLTNLYFGHDFRLYEIEGQWYWEGFGRYQRLTPVEPFADVTHALADAIYALLVAQDTSIADCLLVLEALNLPVVV